MSVWTLYEVFVRSKHGLNHKHVGSVHAADAAMAIENRNQLMARMLTKNLEEAIAARDEGRTPVYRD